MTPIVSTPDALVVYFPSWSVANVKMAGHMMEWKKPINVNIQGLAVSIASTSSTMAPMELLPVAFRKGPA